MNQKNSAKVLIIGICADVQRHGVHHYHQAGDKYIRALTWQSDQVIALIIPAMFHELSAEAQQTLLNTLDGVMLTGSYSNLDPAYYQAPPKTKNEDLRDPLRDSSNWKLIEQLLAARVPILGICRGFQELNVYFGGSLYHRVHEAEGLSDHREDKLQSVDAQYGYAHPVQLSNHGLLASWFAPRNEIQVNSIHMQGVERLGLGLKIEATAPDGLIEAFSHPAYPFLLAVQWHPEWQPEQYADNATVIEGFVQACSEYSEARE